MSKYGGTLQTDIISVLLIQLRSDQPIFYRIRIKGMHSISCALSSLRMPQVLSFSPSKNLTNFSKIGTNLPRTVLWIPIYNNLNKRNFFTAGCATSCFRAKKLIGFVIFNHEPNPNRWAEEIRQKLGSACSSVEGKNISPARANFLQQCWQQWPDWRASYLSCWHDPFWGVCWTLVVVILPKGNLEPGRATSLPKWFLAFHWLSPEHMSTDTGSSLSAIRRVALRWLSFENQLIVWTLFFYNRMDRL